MTPKALVVDDDPDILDAVGDILTSLGHECDHANSVESARQCLECNEYTYVLLDLEIPVRAKSFARIQNGENLLEEIVRRAGTRRKPVIIVMTAHGTDGPELAVEVMKKGAVDYVTKPFKSVGRTLDKSIMEALAGMGGDVSPARQSATVLQHQNAEAEKANEPKAFSGGEMVFYSDRVELCGVTICGGPRCEQSRKTLDLLREKNTKGEFVAFGSKKLAEKIGRDGGSPSVTGLIRDIRTRISAELQNIQIRCGRHDVVVRTNQGYKFNDSVTVHDSDESIGARIQGHGLSRAEHNVPNCSGPDVPDVRNCDASHVRDDDVPDVSDNSAGNRRAWILQQLTDGRRLNSPDVAERFRCSVKTAQRDLQSLKDEGRIEFVGVPRTGCYCLLKPPASGQ